MPGGVVTRDSPNDVVVMSGEFGLDNVHELRRHLESFDAQHPAVIDMAGVTFMDSSVLGLLVMTNRRGIAITIRNPSPFAARALSVSGLGVFLSEP